MMNVTATAGTAWPLGHFFKVLRAPSPEIANDPRENFANPVIGLSQDRKVLIARYAGACGLYCFDAFQASLSKLLREGVKIIILDLRDVSHLSNSLIGVLFDFNAEVFGTGRKLYLYNSLPDLEKTITGLNLHGFFYFLRDEDDLINILPVE